MDGAAVVGLGVVGKATANVFGIKKYFDTDATKSNISIKDLSRLRFIFICLPTPFWDNAGFKTDDIVALIKQIEEYGSTCLYIIRSTVNPGFAVHWMAELGIDSIISNPEFLSEETAEKDTKNPPFVLLGGAIPRYLQEVKALYEGRIKGAPVVLTDNTSAELSKLALNAYFALKVIYANQLYDVSAKIGANYQTVKGVFERHPFGPRNHFQVWYKGKRGVHGHCLPKDTRAFGYYTGSKLIKTVNQLNDEYIDVKPNENL